MQLARKFSRGFALVIGIVLPLAETVRRWGSWFDYLPSYLDDITIGAFLLIAFAISRSRSSAGDATLAAAWGYTCGLGYSSFFGHLQHLHDTDVSGAPNAVITAVIGIGWLLCLIALAATLYASQGRST